MLVLDGRRLRYDVPFTVGDTTYPANWLRLSTREQREELGITEEPDPVRVDQRFFWGVNSPKQFEDMPILDEEGNETGEVTQGLKSQWIQKQKDIAATLLLRTDWYVTRKSETGVLIPDEITALRSQIRAVSEQRESEINSCTSTGDLAALVQNNELTPWPDN